MTVGEVWETRDTPVVDVKALVQSTTGRIIAVGWSATALVSDDNGDTWSTRTIPDSAAWNALVQTDTGRIIAGGFSGSDDTVAYSDDDGDTWTVVPDVFLVRHRRLIQLASGRILGVGWDGYNPASGRYPSMAASTDDGLTWAMEGMELTTGTDRWSDVIQLPGGRVIVVGGSSNSTRSSGAYSDNNGQFPWNRIPEFLDNGFYTSIVRAQSGKLIAAGNNNGLLVSFDDGDTWANGAPFDYPDGELLVTSFGRLIFLLQQAAPDDHFLYSDDEGDTWEVAESPGLRPTDTEGGPSVIELANGRLVAASLTDGNILISDGQPPAEFWTGLRSAREVRRV